MFPINTEKNRLTTIVALAFGYLSLPLLFGVYVYYSFGHGYFPPKADLVGMPLAVFLFLWILCFPVLIAFCFSIEFLGRWMAFLSRRNETTERATAYRVDKEIDFHICEDW